MFKFKLLNLIEENTEENKICVLAYCVMDNHAHFLIYSEVVKHLSDFMKKVNTSYAYFYNKINNRSGYVFKNRFYSQSILNQRHLYACVKYIHNNPVVAGLVNNMRDYKFSSYNEFFSNKRIISNQSLQLLFGSTKNYLTEFNFIHYQEDYGDISFSEKECISIDEIMMKYQKKYGDSFLKDRSIVREFLSECRNKTDATLVELAKLLGYSKSKVDYIIKKDKKCIV